MSRPESTGAPPKRSTVDDGLVLSSASACMRARAQAALIWAQIDEADRYCSRRGVNYDRPELSVAIAEFQSGLTCLAAYEPRTVRGAVAVLGVVLDILVRRMLGPEDTVLGEGPVIEIVRNVRNALQETNQDHPLVLSVGEAA